MAQSGLALKLKHKNETNSEVTVRRKTLIRKHLAEGVATPRELFLRIEKGPHAAEILGNMKNPVKSIASILHNGDIEYNSLGWCIAVGRHPLSYSTVDQLCKSSDSGLGIYVPLLKNFLFAQKICTKAINVDCDWIAGSLLPHIVGTTEELRPSTATPPAGIVACVLVPELSEDNFSTIMSNTMHRVFWANEAYLATPCINEDCVDQPLLEMLATIYGIGVIHIDYQGGENKTRLILPARHKPEYKWDYIASFFCYDQGLKEFLWRSSDSCPASPTYLNPPDQQGDYFDLSWIHRGRPPRSTSPDKSGLAGKAGG
jgi:hypothetical protein